MNLPTALHDSPKDVFDAPHNYMTFITAPDDNSFEGQYFDRKEAGRLRPGESTLIKSEFANLRDQLAECVSAFANSNQVGGLIVVGISKVGEITGIDYLTDEQKQALATFSDLLVFHHTEVRFHTCTDSAGLVKLICLIYVPYTERGICETVGRNPKAWVRQGVKNSICDSNCKDTLRRNKRLVDFENTYCCPYDSNELDRGVVEEFRRLYLADTPRAFTDEEMLHQVGAIEKHNDGYVFNHAGYLFFAANPQRRLSWAYIRLMRFDHVLQLNGQRAIHSFEKKFGGSLPEQIRAILSFFRESAFFKVYQRRKPEGGFIEEPELPPNAINEAIVNAIVHRDYAVQLPIECEHYRDALLVTNPGRLRQRDDDVPDQFTLEERRLNHKPQNPKLLEWLKVMRDKDGTPLIKAISEGTWQMQTRMAEMGLPSPAYLISASQTRLTLISNAPQREEGLRKEAVSGHVSPYFANLFQITFSLKQTSTQSSQRDALTKNFLTALKNALYTNNWYIDTDKFSRVVAHQRGNAIRLPALVRDILGLYPAYIFSLKEYWGNHYLCIDYKLEVKNLQTVRALCDIFDCEDMVGLTAAAQIAGWQRGRIISADSEFTRIRLFEQNTEEVIASDRVIPSLPRTMLDRLVAETSTSFDLSRSVKEHGLSLQQGAARIRAEKTITIAQYLAANVFPLSFNNLTATVSPEPTSLMSRFPEPENLQVYLLPEPSVEFNRQHEAVDIREGITKFGAYDNQQRAIEIVPICTMDLREQMATLLETIRVGKYSYKGAERTFGTRLTHHSIITVSSVETIFDECQRLLNAHPEWIGHSDLDRIFLIQTPDTGYSSDDEQAPYYKIKRLLLENGIPCQMLRGNTIRKPEWKDLNLILNIIAKCGVTPWVLPDAIPDADFFIGLSYTENIRRDSRRLMGYANVFNQYGRWQFYSANSETFLYSDKEEYFKRLVRETLEKLPLSETPSIYFHYSAKFSRDDRRAILSAARSIRPQGTYTFVWINTDHDVRIYDSRAETDGSLSRGGYVTTSQRQIILSTTGNNPYRKALGTPSMLELNIWIDPPEGIPFPKPDLKSLAVQIINLTKLNWASTNAFCGEPITTYYAHHIAYLTAAFLRQTPTFKLHPILEKTPWFI